MPSKATSSVTLAIIGQKIDHLAEHMQKIERRMDERDSAYQNLSRDQALIHQEVHGDGGIMDQLRKQWTRHDWETRAIWGLIVSNSVTMLFLLGQKAIAVLSIIKP